MFAQAITNQEDAPVFVPAHVATDDRDLAEILHDALEGVSLPEFDQATDAKK